MPYNDYTITQLFESIAISAGMYAREGADIDKKPKAIQYRASVIQQDVTRLLELAKELENV